MWLCLCELKVIIVILKIIGTKNCGYAFVNQLQILTTKPPKHHTSPPQPPPLLRHHKTTQTTYNTNSSSLQKRSPRHRHFSRQNNKGDRGVAANRGCKVKLKTNHNDMERIGPNKDETGQKTYQNRSREDNTVVLFRTTKATTLTPCD